MFSANFPLTGSVHRQVHALNNIEHGVCVKAGRQMIELNFLGHFSSRATYCSLSDSAYVDSISATKTYKVTKLTFENSTSFHSNTFPFYLLLNVHSANSLSSREWPGACAPYYYYHHQAHVALFLIFYLAWWLITRDSGITKNCHVKYFFLAATKNSHFFFFGWCVCVRNRVI